MSVTTPLMAPMKLVKDQHQLPLKTTTFLLPTLIMIRNIMRFMARLNLVQLMIKLILNIMDLELYVEVM